jgi:uncharacterized protein (TIGR02647 family)
MILTPALVEEIEMLCHYNLSTTQMGFKVHKTADVATIGATRRLFEKGLITQNDGGYLTPLGMEVAEHAQNMITIMTSAQLNG